MSALRLAACKSFLALAASRCSCSARRAKTSLCCCLKACSATSASKVCRRGLAVRAGGAGAAAGAAFGC
eukprot:4866474-Alexandrium_andersonii.AAC.1